MSENQVTVLAIITAKPGKEQQLQEEAQKLVAPTRQEDGCINYDLHFPAGDNTKVMFHENWTCQAALDAHLETPKLVNFLALLEEIAQDTEVSLWQMQS